MEQRKSLMRNQEGFTLIEIIAVLVLLGILAAVAVPKYFDLQTDAKKRAVEGALMEGVARTSQGYAQFLLKNGGKLPTLADLQGADGAGIAGDATGTAIGDFTYTLTGDSGAVVITVIKGKFGGTEENISAGNTKTLDILLSAAAGGDDD